jgi:hypothetical protein
VRTLTLPVPTSSLLGWFVLFASGFGQGPTGQGSGGFGGQGFGGQGFGGQPAGPPNPYAGAFGPQAPPPRRSNAWLWILGGLGLGGLVLCGCCGGFFMFGMSQVSTFMKQEVAGHPAVVQHIGEIRSLSTNVMASGEESQKRGNGANVIVFDVRGSNGKGQLLGEQSRNPQPGHFFDRIDLKLPSGEEISIK